MRVSICTVIGLPSAAAGGFHRQVLDLRVEVFFLLIALRIEVLLEITLVVEQTASDQRHAQRAGALDMVAGKHAQAAGIDRHRLMHAEFEGKIGDGPRAEHARIRAAPGGNLVHDILSVGEKPG